MPCCSYIPPPSPPLQLDDAGTEINGKCLLERLHSLGFTHDSTLEHMCALLAVAVCCCFCPCCCLYI